MKRLLLPALAIPCLLFFAVACGDPPAAVEAPPVKERPKPKVFRPDDLKAESAERDAALDREIAALETEAEKLRQEIAREQLTMDQAALQEELARLEEERAALLRTLPPLALPVDSLADPAPAPLPPSGDYDLFYTGLSDYGQWFESVEYGYVWQPVVAKHASWRPYTVGSWTACDRGWVWVSEEPFGWATYHYGRWACLKNRGWIWVPGEIWAPAWVAWRRSSDYVGWCPLPPETLYQTSVTYDSTIDQRCGLQPSCYIFIAAKHFCLPVHRHGEPASHSLRICRNTTNITRLTVSRHGVDRCGPAYDWIRQCLGHAPLQYRLACGPRPPGGSHSLIEGNRLCLYAPRMQAPWNPLLRPGMLAGTLPLTVADRQDATPTAEGLRSFREARRSWQDGASRAMKETPVQRFAERQEKIRSLQSTLTTAATTPPAPPARAAGPETTPQSSVQRRELRNAAAEKIASQRQQLNRMRGQEESRDVAVRMPQTSPAVTAAPGTRSAPPTRLPTPATRSTERPTVATAANPNTRPGRTQPPGIAIRPDSATRSTTQELPAPSQTSPAFRHATTTAIIPGRPAPGDPVSATDPGIPPAGDQADPRAAQAARLKEEIAANRQALMDQRNGTAPDVPGTLPRNAAEERTEADRQQQTARQHQAEEQARQQALAEAEAAAAQQQAMAEDQAQAEAQARRNLQAARDAEQSRIQRAAMEQAAQQQQQQQQAARAQEIARQQQMAEQRQRQAAEMARQQEAARQQQLAEQQQRQAEAIARQQEAARQQQMVEQQQRQAEAIARQQEAARQQQMAEQQQRQAEAIARQQDAARQQQMVEQRQRQAEDTARQKEAVRQQQENEQRQRQAQEAARQQEAVRQQKTAEEGARRTGR